MYLCDDLFTIDHWAACVVNAIDYLRHLLFNMTVKRMLYIYDV